MNAFYYSSVEEAIRHVKTKENKGYVLLSSIDKVNELSKLVGDNVVLCSTSGEYTPEGYKNETITGFEYDLDEAEVVEIMYPPVKSTHQLKRAYENAKNNPNAFMFLLCDGLSGMEEGIITTLYFIDKNFKIIGGSAGDYLQFKETFIYIGGKRVYSAAIFFDVKQRTQLIKENIFVPVGKTLLVTEADPINRTVKTFNNKPASTEYANILGVSEADLPNHLMDNPLGKIYKDDIFIASPMKVNADKSITFYCQIMPNTFVEVLRPSNPIEKIKETIGLAQFRPKFVLSINCILRSLKFQQDGIWKDLDKEMLGMCRNVSGFVSYGEQYFKHHSNQTMVLLLVE